MSGRGAAPRRHAAVAIGFAAVLVLAAAAPAQAIPRFAVRTGLPCAACHVLPTGGGMRTAFGRNVFARQWLAAGSRADAADAPPSVEVADKVALGADMRAGYLWLKSARAEIADTSALALMQGDFYLHVEVDPRIAFYLDRGVYGGFETFLLARPLGAPGARELTVRVGRLVLPFGLRDVNHATFVREGIGFGPTDRDSAVEVGASWGRLAAHASLSNGTYGDSFFDADGSANPGIFDKAVALRVFGQAQAGPVRTLLALSGFLNRNTARQSPLFVPALFVGSQSSRIKEGLDEIRVGLAAGAALGRLAWRGEIVGVRDVFSAADLRTMTGYASYQDLSLVVVRGLELSASHEFADSDLDFRRGRIDRIGGGVEWFPRPSLELSVLYRHQFGPADFLIGARQDAILFAHIFL